MQIFDYLDYKTYIRDRVQNMTRKGRGEFRKIAQALTVSSTVISHIFNGDRHLNTDQGLQLANYFGLNTLETKYLISIISRERAGTYQLKQFYENEIKSIRAQTLEVKNRLNNNFDEVSEEIRAQFYSDWIYIAVQLLTALPGYNTIDEISDYFNLQRDRIQKVVGFLLLHGFLVEEAGHLNTGPQQIHLDRSSQVINTYRRNWRLKSLERINQPQSEDLFFTYIATVSKKDAVKIKNDLLEAIARANKVGADSAPEQLWCMNMDWFELK